VPSFDELQVGDAAPPLVVENLTRTHFVKYAGASGDFNPMHHDDTIATRVGNPSVFGHGMLTAGLMARVVKDWFGPEAMRRFSVRFAKQVWPGESLTFTAVVTGKRSEDGADLVDLDLSARNADGEEKLAGTATAAV
jgi:peroxisomal enoyl-CoA hydratase 2